MILNNIFQKFKNMGPNKRKTITVITIIIIILIIISIITAIILQTTSNNASKIYGNLNNNGFAIEKGNKIYISNTLLQTGQDSIEKGLYEINSKNEIKLISKDEFVNSINYYKGYIYYLAINKAENGNYIRQVVKIKRNGENKQILVDNIETTSIGNNSLNVENGWIYYSNSDNKLEKVKINGEKRQQLADEEVKRFQVVDKYIYYATKDDEFKRMKKDGSAIEKLENGIDSFQVISNDVYYISQANGYLMKWNIKDKTTTEIVKNKIKVFNINKKTIYYAVNENTEQAIYKKKIKNDKIEKVVDLDSANVFICIIGNWIYYTDKVENSPYYFTFYKINKDGGNRTPINI